MLRFPQVSFRPLKQAFDDLTEAVEPLYQFIYESLRNQNVNEVVQLPKEQILSILIDPSLLSCREQIEKYGIWGLKLEITMPTDDEIGKLWVKQALIGRSMLSKAANETDIGFSDPTTVDEPYFKPPSSSLRSIPVMEGQVILAVAIGSHAQEALEEAVAMNEQFNPSDWDLDGYYVGP